VFLQINTVKYDVDWEITNIYKNLQIVWSHFSPICYYSLIFGLLQISISLSVFRFIANEYKRITIHSLLTIRKIRSGIRWTKMKVILNYSMLPSSQTCGMCNTGVVLWAHPFYLLNGWVASNAFVYAWFLLGRHRPCCIDLYGSRLLTDHS
jgi:hypothetical protein